MRNFINILKTNKEGLEYLQKNPNTKVTNITLINPQDFEKLKNQTEYKDLYINLPNKQLYYIEFSSNKT